MKRILQFAALLAVCGMIACQCDSKEETPDVPEPTPVTPDDPKPDDPPTPQPPEPQPVQPEPGTYTFVLPDGNFKPAWEVGDEISIRGNYAPDMITITLAQENISEDGKTATVELTALPKTFCSPDYLYAAYPASAVEFDSSFCEPTTRFVGDNQPIMVSYWTEGNTFTFKGACGEIIFTLDASGYDAVVFGGAAREDILFDNLKATYSSEQTLTTKKPTDGRPFLVLPAQSGEYRIYVPSKTTFNKGFYVWLKKGDTYPVAYNYTESTSFRSGMIIELGDISSQLATYEGMAPEEMKMPEILSRKEYDINIPELSGICLTEDGESLWGVGDEGQLAIISFTEDDKVQIQNIKHFGNDLEAVTRDPVTNTLYIGTEPNSVYRCESPFTSYTRIFKIAEASGYGNSGIEGIAWYKDNTLYVGTQVGANLWRCDLEGNILDFISLKDVRASLAEIGGLCYDPVLDWLWVTDSETHSLYVFSGDGRIYYGKYKLSPSYNNESVCVDHKHGCVWVGDDNDSQPRLIRLEMPGLNEIQTAE